MICLALLLGMALALGVSAQAAAQGNDQQTGSQQQSAGQQNAMSSEQADKLQKTDNSDKASSKGQRVLVGRGQRSDLIIAQAPPELLASSLIGMTIKNKAGTVGSVTDLIMNSQRQVVGVVDDMHGILGLIGKNVGISWKAVTHVDPKQGVLMVNVSQSQLQKAPAFATQKALDNKHKGQNRVLERYQE